MQTMKVNSVAKYAKFEGLKPEEKYTVREKAKLTSSTLFPQLKMRNKL